MIDKTTIAAIAKLVGQINRKRHSARQAGLEVMTLQQFVELSLSSPNWQKIGRHKGQYHFCRRDHSKGYTLDNVFIGSGADNIRERVHRRGVTTSQLHTPQANAKRSKRRAKQRVANRKHQKLKWLTKWRRQQQLDQHQQTQTTRAHYKYL